MFQPDLTVVVDFNNILFLVSSMSTTDIIHRDKDTRVLFVSFVFSVSPSPSSAEDKHKHAAENRLFLMLQSLSGLSADKTKQRNKVCMLLYICVGEHARVCVCSCKIVIMYVRFSQNFYVICM